MKSWSEELKKRTFEALDRIDIVCFMRDNRVHMKHISKEGNAGYGFITLENALKNQWILEDRTGKIHEFNTIHQLIQEGRAID